MGSLYAYRVLRRQPVDPEKPDGAQYADHKRPLYRELGIFEAPNPDAAALAAADKYGEPGSYLALSERNCHEVSVAPKSGFEVGAPPAPAATHEPALVPEADADAAGEEPMPIETPDGERV
jgi:cytochrome c1